MSVRYPNKIVDIGIPAMVLAAGYTLLVGWFAIYFDIFPPIFHVWWTTIFHFYIFILFLLSIYYIFTKGMTKQTMVQIASSATIGGTLYTLLLGWLEGEYFSTWWWRIFTVYTAILAFVGFYFGVLQQGGHCCGERRGVEDDKAK